MISAILFDVAFINNFTYRIIPHYSVYFTTLHQILSTYSSLRTINKHFLTKLSINETTKNFQIHHES